MTASYKKQSCVRSHAIVFLLLLITIVASTAAQAAVWRVNAASTAPSPDGQSWATAFPFLQYALDAAAFGDELWVAAGTYTGTGGVVVGLKAGVALYGGFAGTETAREQRDWTAHPTIIDGQGARRCVGAVAATSVVDGFTLQNGRESCDGGGMSHGTAVNCVFTKNTSCYGGGLSYGTAVNCVFTGNSGYSGGGAYSSTATHCIFTGNTAKTTGGGMIFGTATNCTVTGNTAKTTGGGICVSTAVNCIIWANTPNTHDKDNIPNKTTVSYSCVSEATTGMGNIVGDPLFVNAAAGDFRLQPGSPCIDTGTTTGAPTADMVGTPRPQGTGVDMGAYEVVVPVTVPDLSGLTRTAAIDMIVAAQLYAAGETQGYHATIPADHVIRQNPLAGTLVAQRTPVDVVVSKGPPPPPAPMPDLTGLARAEARERVAAAELYVRSETYEYDPAVPNDHVIRQTPAAGVQVLAETPVDLVISTRPQRVVWRVNAASTAPLPDGQSWATAYPTIQSAVDAAAIGTELWVAAGTYTGIGAQVANLKAVMRLYGGFVGTETAREQRDWKANPTVIDGQQARRCVTGVAQTSTVDGFTLQNGYATNGGGMSGGTAINCTFNWNSSSHGGGMYYGTAINCTFSRNSSDAYGGGMESGTAVNCVFTGNTARALGAGMNFGAATNCTFTKNSCAGDGAGMYQGSATNCIIWGNAPGEIYLTAVSFSCLPFAVEGKGNIAGSPGFVDPHTDDLRLRADSPCVDAGDAQQAPNTDLLGRARPQGARVDMGAYEYFSGDDENAAPAPPVLRVNAASVNASPDGMTWQTAFPTIQAAVERSGYGGEIWVAEGTYTGTGLQVVSIPWVSASVFGGFTGTETLREQRLPTLHPTIIDGQRSRRCVAANGTVLVDGFVLQNGKADLGAGMYGGAAANCAFTGNAAAQDGGGSYSGLANNCTFSGNTAGWSGAGIYRGTAANCVFSGNTAGEAGGGMCEGKAVNCLFLHNAAGSGESWRGGGGMYNGAAMNCTFSGNRGNGGGMLDGTATNCIIWGNLGKETDYTTVSYSCLSTSALGTGNIVGDPLFMNAAAGDFRLQPGSPCIDIGTGVGAPANDLLGVPRPQFAGVDMGAYEAFGVSVTVPDLTGLARSVARDLVVASELYLRNETDEYHSTIPTDHVVRQNPAAGVQVLRNSHVDLVISKGPARVWRVSAASIAPTPDGQSWDTAYPSIQPAIDAAGPDDNLWVAAGTYIGTGTEVVKLKAGITLYGGFAGTETARDQRDWTANPTIIDGQGARRCVTAVATETVDGFTLQNGKSYSGGGMFGGQATNCTFLGNTASDESAGGGMYEGTAANCVFAGNSATYGGGMCYGKATNCTFTGNAATTSGGGMVVGTATNCTFAGNKSEYGGGMNRGTAVNCVFWGNAADETFGTTVSYSCLSTAEPGVGNITGNPLLVNAAAGDFRLRPGSPCIDAGTATGAPANDLLGVPRPQGAGHDMGAYEAVLVTMPDLSGLARTAAREVVAAAQLYVRHETDEYDPTVPNDHVIHQTPVAAVQVLPKSPVDLVISKGPQPEGEIGEGEGEVVDNDALRQQLTDDFDTADKDGDGNLSLAEARLMLPGLTQTVFNQLDTNGDGQLTAIELSVDQGTGCAGCQGSKGAFHSSGITKGLSEMFLTGLGLIGLAAMAAVRRP